MASFFVSETGQVLEAAKRAAVEAVAGYSAVTPYTIGIAVQAAASVLGAGAAAGIEPTGTLAARPARPGRDDLGAIEVTAVEVTPRLRALESVARAAQATHAPHTRESDCLLCAALRRLDHLEAAS